MKRKLTRATLSELELHAEIMKLFEQKRIVGGGNGTYQDPFTYSEWLQYAGTDAVYYYDQVGHICWSGQHDNGDSGAGYGSDYGSGSGSSYGSDYGYGSGSDYGYSSDYGYGSDYGSDYGYSTSSGYGTEVNVDGYHIVFSSSAASGSMSTKSANVLKQAMIACGDNSIQITSTARTVEDQARVMYENIKKTSVDEQKKIYKNPGKAVIDVYDPKLSKSENIANMANKIREEGPSNVSHHCADFNETNVFDVAKSSVSNGTAFVKSLKDRGYKVLDENGCYHVEISQTNH